jgi:hypothetical protein
VGLAELLAHMSVSDIESYDNSDLSVLLEPTPDEKRLLRSALNLLREPYVKK